jgi:hypothetical protein
MLWRGMQEKTRKTRKLVAGPREGWANLGVFFFDQKVLVIQQFWYVDFKFYQVLQVYHVFLHAQKNSIRLGDLVQSDVYTSTNHNAGQKEYTNFSFLLFFYFQNETKPSQHSWSKLH